MKVLKLLFLTSWFSASIALSAHGDEHLLTVMSQNLYLGADTSILLNDPEKIDPNTVARLWDKIKKSNFRARADKIAAAIEHYKVDVLGLQEVAHFDEVPGLNSESNSGAGKPRVPGDLALPLDYLQVLKDALKRRGMNFKLALENENLSIKLPIFFKKENSFPRLGEIRFKDRDAILVREELAFENLFQGRFQAQASIRMGGRDIKYNRGFQVIVIKNLAQEILLANMRLEDDRSRLGFQVQKQQIREIREMQKVLPEKYKSRIFLGDLNSGPGSQAESPYQLLTNDGFLDSMLSPRAALAAVGGTCCFNEDLSGVAEGLSERFDHIFYRGSMRVLGVKKVGIRENERTAAGLWPSDHAGVVSMFSI